MSLPGRRDRRLKIRIVMAEQSESWLRVLSVPLLDQLSALDWCKRRRLMGLLKICRWVSFSQLSLAKPPKPRGRGLIQSGRGGDATVGNTFE